MEGIRSGLWPLPSRADLLRALALAVLSGLIWCAFFNRWTVQSWNIPLEYTAKPEQCDTLFLLAAVKAARDGHYAPFGFIDVPQLGAPFGGNWNDYPFTEKPILWLTGILARFIGLFAAANFAVLFAQVLAALSFYAAGRLLGVSWLWAFAGALVFAFCTYAFSRELHHLTVLYFWHIPLCLVVCEWVLRGGGLRFGDRRFLFALAVAVVAGVQNQYYSVVFIQFLAWGGLLQMWRQGWRAVWPTGALIATTGLAFVLMNANTLAYHLVHGPDSGIVQREYKWLEIYGLKPVDMVIPPPNYRIPWLGAQSAHYGGESVLSPGEIPPSAYLGIVGLAALGGLIFVSVRRLLDGKRLPLEAWLILWLVLEGGVGGLNSLLGLMGLTIFRATTRYSIFILAIVLLFGVRRLSELHWKNRFLPMGAAFAIALLALADQTPPIVSANELAATARAVADDRDFTQTLEARLGPRGMIFQLPAMGFPEGAVTGVLPYDHLRFYLYSDSLRFSFGSDKGRPREEWQKTVLLDSLPQGIDMLQLYGFGAIYVNRNGFQDRAAGLEKSFKAAGLTDQIHDATGDRFCVFLKPSPQPILPPVPLD